MDYLDELLKVLGINVAALFTGAIGAFISLKATVELGVLGRFTSFAGGAFAAGILAEPAIDYFALKSSYLAAFGFVIGVFSMAILARGMKVIKEFDIISYIKERLSSKGSGE